MSKLWLVLFAALSIGVLDGEAATPDCLYQYHFTNRTGDNGTFGQTVLPITSSTASIKNVLSGCTAWSLSYNSEGLSALSIVLQDAPNSYSSGATPGTFVTFAGTTITGSNPMTNTNSGLYTATGYYPWINVSLTTATGTGSIDVTLAGWKTTTMIAALSIGGTAGGDLSGTYPNPSVVGLGGGDATYAAHILQLPSATGVYRISTDTGISRDSAGVFDIGNGTAGDKSGAIKGAYISPLATENGANNAIACAAGCGPPLTTGLHITIVLAHGVAAGTGTFAYNGGAALNIRSHRQPAAAIATGYSIPGIMEMIYDGTQWEDLSQ